MGQGFDRQFVAVAAEAGNDAIHRRGDQAGVPERLALVNVGKVKFNGWNLGGLQGIWSATEVWV